MTMTDLESALDDVRDADGIVDVRECEDASLVDEVEESLGVEFCRELREFHEKYEYIQIGFEEFTWIRTMGDTIAGIRSSSRDIPEHYVPILSDGRGGHYYVVCRKRGEAASDDIGRVFYNPGDEPNALEFTASDFFAFAIARARFWEKNC